jgi:lipoate-protein ligase A
LETFNEDVCKENNIQVFPLHTGGGTIVGTQGDFSLGMCIPSNLSINDNFILNQIKDIIQKHTLKTVSVNKNDILIDGNKICGSATYQGKDVIMVIMHFSFSDRADLISKICITNKTNKPIGFIDSMTRKEFKQEVSAWLL